ncbi:MAG: regulatory protein RecX, partial [Candidatus Neomarinimicrobiota bacterium]|nr:regulatory protein RecX [Candidatus Neomarinimicrobiota bacterium]
MWKLTHKIQSIVPQKKRKNRFTVTLESGDVFGISGDVLISNSLVVGQALTKKTLEHLIHIETQQQIKVRILRLLSYRHRSRAEVLTLLKRKGYSEDDFVPVLDELDSKGYMDDKAFATMYASYLIKKKSLGRIAVKYKFSQHKIANDLLDSILDELYVTYPPEEMVQQIMDKRISVHGTSLKEMQKLVNLLKRKGFRWQDIEPIINKV